MTTIINKNKHEFGHPLLASGAVAHYQRLLSLIQGKEEEQEKEKNKFIGDRIRAIVDANPEIRNLFGEDFTKEKFEELLREMAASALEGSKYSTVQFVDEEGHGLKLSQTTTIAFQECNTPEERHSLKLRLKKILGNRYHDLVSEVNVVDDVEALEKALGDKCDFLVSDIKLKPEKKLKEVALAKKDIEKKTVGDQELMGCFEITTSDFKIKEV